MPKKTDLQIDISNPATRFTGHAYLNPDGSVNGEKLLSIVNRTPAAFELMMLNSMIERGTIAPEYYDMAEEIVGNLVTVMMLAGYGDEQSGIQLKAVKKLTHPAKYDLPLSKIRDIVDRYETSPPLARAWELRRLMSYISVVVEPLNANKPYLSGHPVKMRELAAETGLWDVAQRHMKPNTTLQSLAFAVYIEQLEEIGVIDENAPISGRSLKRDLDLARQWELTASEDEKIRRGRTQGYSLSDEPIVWYQFSEGWKVRKLAAHAQKRKAIAKAHSK